MQESTSVKTAQEPTVIPATSGTLSQSAYLELREKLLQSAPQRRGKGSSLSPEEKKRLAAEAIQKKRITKKESAAALNVYKPWKLEP